VFDEGPTVHGCSDRGNIGRRSATRPSGVEDVGFIGGSEIDRSEGTRGMGEEEFGMEDKGEGIGESSGSSSGLSTGVRSGSSLGIMVMGAVIACRPRTGRSPK
jgi:hypothetical protein